MSFVNFSNHPSLDWGLEQREAAERYGTIIDVPFPVVSGEADENTVSGLVRQYAEKILEYKPAAVMCQGEYTLVYGVVTFLRSKGILCLSACSERVVLKTEQNGDTSRKETEYHFVRFRQFVEIDF